MKGAIATLTAECICLGKVSSSFKLFCLSSSHYILIPQLALQYRLKQINIDLVL